MKRRNVLMNMPQKCLFISRQYQMPTNTSQRLPHPRLYLPSTTTKRYREMHEDLTDGFGSFIWEIGDKTFEEEGECGASVLGKHRADCCWVFRRRRAGGGSGRGGRGKGRGEMGRKKGEDVERSENDACRWTSKGLKGMRKCEGEQRGG